ncbi:hypothetical protein AAC387_Pa12g2323 [Persea americana]
MPPKTRNGEGPSKGKALSIQRTLAQNLPPPPPQQRRSRGRSPTVQTQSRSRGVTMLSLRDVPPPEQPRHSHERARQGDKSITKPREKSARAGSQSHHQASLDQNEDPRLDDIRAQNRLIQEQHELIQRLKQQLDDKKGQSPPPRRLDYGRDLRHVLNNKRRTRDHREEGSSSSHVHEGLKKQRQVSEDEELKQWIDRRVKQTIRQNMETAGIVRDQYSAFEAEDTGASPFSREIRKYSLPEKFNVPRFALYDGTSDPAAHLRHYVQRMSVWGDDDSLNCRVFSFSLADLPLRWFCSLPEDSISSWRQLRTSFLGKFQAHRVVPKTNADLMALRMQEDESVTQFARRFWTVYSQIECASEELAVKFFQLALWPGIQLRAQLVMYPVTTMKEPMTQANRFILAEEDEVRGRENFGLTKKNQPAKGDSKSSRREDRRRDPSPDRRKGRSSEQRRTPSTSAAASGNGRRSGHEVASHVAVNTIFKEPIYRLLNKIKAQPFFKWPWPITTDPSSRDQSKFCTYHKQNGHRTDECRSYKFHLENLVKEGHLRDYIKEEGRGDDRPPRRDADNQDKTTFITPRGTYCYKVMPFGLKNARATYQRLVTKMFQAQLGKTVEVYIDDMVVKSKRRCNNLNTTFSSPPLLSTPTIGDALFLYLSVSDHAVSSVLIREDNGQQRPIYYTSKTLLDAETRYLQLEKLALALVSASRKLSHYFQTFTIVVVTEYPLKALLRKADFSGRISKWAVELGQYDISYQPRTAIKAQVLADFIVEFTPQSSAPTSLDTELGGDRGAEVVTETEQEQSWRELLDSSWKVFVDGSSTSKRASAGIVLQSSEGLVIKQALTLGFKASNNEAEYEALIAGLNSVKILEARSIVVFSDSQLVASQLNGDYQARDDRMAAYLAHARGLLSQFERAEVLQIGRESNSHADALASLASAVEAGNKRTIEVETLREPSIDFQQPRQLMCLDLGPSWMDPIIACLKDNQLPEDRTEARKVRLKATRFWLSPVRSPQQSQRFPLRDSRRNLRQSYRRSVSCVPSYQPRLLVAVHAEGRPALCQKMRKVPEVLSLSPPASLGPEPPLQFVAFRLVGPGHRRTTPPNSREQKMNVITRFGIPRTLVSDNGTQFDSNFFKSFYQEYGIRNVYSTLAYPQSNGQAEISNKVLLDGIKKRLDRAKGRWAEELPSVLSAYRTTPMRSTSATPFSLAYGMEAVIPLEVGLLTLRSELCDQGLNDLNVARELNLAEERREAAAIRLAAYQQQLAKGYNPKVKERKFAMRELVLKKTLPGDRDPNEGKLAPNWQGPFRITSKAGRSAY